MNDKFREILNRIEENEVKIPENLMQNIMLKVDKDIRQKKIFKVVKLSVLSVISFSALIPIISNISTSLSQSGIYNYLSFIMDKEILLSYWRELIVVIAEALPTTGILILLVTFTTFIWSIGKIKNETRLLILKTS